MVVSYNFGHLYIHLWEWISLPFYLLIIYFISKYYQERRIAKNPVYKFYQRGLYIKILGGIFFALIYYYYYKGGDTFSYFESAMVMKNTMFESFSAWFKNEFGQANDANFSLFTNHTGYPLPYMYNDTQTFAVIRLINPLLILSFNGYLITSILVAWISYSGVWRLFLVFTNYYPHLKKQLFITIVCFPSVIFWASGILKDTITLCCTGWAVYAIYKAFIERKGVIRYLLILLVSLYLILLIKPYIILALLPGTLIWVFSQKIQKMHNILLKVLIIPAIFVACFSGAYYLVKNLNGYLGKFSIEKIEKTALVTSNDLKQSYYGGHSFDIGPIDNTLAGYAKIFPKAFTAGAYRPFIWESSNIVMLFSGIENMYLLYLTFIILVKVRFNVIKRILREPMLIFAMGYSIFFAFSVGLTTSNFGALVRFRVAYLPFFASALLVLRHKKGTLPEASVEESNTDLDTRESYTPGLQTY
jgi:hypothetical protein